MGTAVRKTISLPPELAKEAEEVARTEGITLSAVIQGIVTEKDLERYLKK